MAEINQRDLTDFRCIRCHACCRQEGYVRLRPGEADRIARFLEMDLLSFTRKYTRLTRDRQTLSLVEKENKECIFLEDDGCRIHEVKPGQCRDFPLRWKFSEFEKICGWAKNRSRAGYNPSMESPSSSSK